MPSRTSTFFPEKLVRSTNPRTLRIAFITHNFYSPFKKEITIVPNKNRYKQHVSI
jgi:hypothetical protein